MENSFDKIKVKKKNRAERRKGNLNQLQQNESVKKQVPTSFFVFLRFQMDADFQKSIWIPAFSSSGITDLVKYHISELPPNS